MATKETTKSDELVKKIEAELTCAICLDQFNDPKVLPCLHTYCRKCVESLVERSLQLGPAPREGDSNIVCPQCREAHVLPQGGAGKLLTSFTFTNLVQVLEVHKADQTGDGGKTLTCENGLDTDPATARCLDCDAYLCSTCLTVHQKQIATKKHTTVTLDEIKEKGDKCFHRPQYCIKHDKEVLKLYCRTCSEPICGDCTYVDHRTHEYVFLSDIQKELKKMLTEKVTSLKGVVELAKDKKEKLDALMEIHKARVADIHAEIDKTIEKQIVNLKKRQAELHKEVEEKAKQQEKTISTDNESAEFNLVRLASIIKFTERLLQTGSGAEIAAMASRSVEQCEKLEGIVKENENHIQECDLLTWKVGGIQSINDSIACLKILNESIAERHIQLLQPHFKCVEEEPPSVVEPLYVGKRRSVVEPPSVVKPVYVGKRRSVVEPPSVVEALYVWKRRSVVEPPSVVECRSVVEPPSVVECRSVVEPPSVGKRRSVGKRHSVVEPPSVVECRSMVEPPSVVECRSVVEPHSVVEHHRVVEPQSNVRRPPRRF